jgi:hypothetical protein
MSTNAWNKKWNLVTIVMVGVVAFWWNNQYHAEQQAVTPGFRVDETTGLAFAETMNFRVGKKLTLQAVGTRKLAILNIYSLGIYLSKPITKIIAKNNNNNKSSNTPCDTILQSKAPRAVQIQFAMGIGPERIAEAVSQLSGVSESVRTQFHDLVLNGIQQQQGQKMMKAKEVMTFEWKGNDVIVVTVRGQYVGEMKDRDLAMGVLELYVGTKSVSPSLRKHLGCL